MSELATLDGFPLLSGEMTKPPSWAWTAEVQFSQVEIADGFSVGQLVTLEVDGVSHVGTVTVGSSPELRGGLRLVGGAGRLPTALEPRDYKGQTAEQVVRDALRDAGEQVGDLSALRRYTLAHWSRARAPAGYSLTRLMRSTSAWLRPGRDGAWTAVEPTWTSRGDYDEARAASFPSEDAIEIRVFENLPEPGESIRVLDEDFKIDRVQVTWKPDQRMRAILWRWDPSTPLDRLHAPQQAIQRNLRAEDFVFDFSLPVRGRLAKDGGSDGRASVFVDDERARIQTLEDVQLLTPTGEVWSLAKGTRVTVGWFSGDERFPYVLADGGGLASKVVTFADRLALVGDDLRLGSDDPLLLDAVVTKKDLQTLFSAIQNAGVDAQGGLLAAPLITALGNAGWGPAVPPATSLGSSIVGAKR